MFEMPRNMKYLGMKAEKFKERLGVLQVDHFLSCIRVEYDELQNFQILEQILHIPFVYCSD